MVQASLLLPACTDPCSEGPGIYEFVASAARWLHLLEPFDVPDGDGSLEVSMNVAIVGKAGEGPGRIETVAVYDAFAPEIERLLDEGEVYLAVASKNLERGSVLYVVVRDDEGSYRLAGGRCMREGENFLRDRLGEDFDATIGGIIGETEREQILRALRWAA